MRTARAADDRLRQIFFLSRLILGFFALCLFIIIPSSFLFTLTGSIVKYSWRVPATHYMYIYIRKLVNDVISDSWECVRVTSEREREIVVGGDEVTSHEIR